MPLLRYQQALAQSTRRKLALLIGVNAYSQAVVGETLGDTGPMLQGCITDTALQRELLVHRFGFQPADILTLTDQQATRRGIVEAFDQHLRSQVQPGDVVVVHFSGYGSQLHLGNETLTSWVPVDGKLPSQGAPLANDLTETTLKQLLKTLKTKAVTTVMDTGFTAPGHPLTGGFKVRARPVSPTGSGLAELSILSEVLGEKFTVPQLFPGLVLRAALPHQWAIECDWDEVSAGLFTYALTRQLWSSTPPTKLIKLMGRTQESVLQLAPQTPNIDGQRSDGAQRLYDGMGADVTVTDAVVTGVKNRTASLWLGGLSPEALPYSDRAWFEPIGGETAASTAAASPAADTPPGDIATSNARPARSRNGLVAQLDLSNLSADQLAAWTVGTTVVEALRVLPRDVDLVVAIDQGLARIERVDATSALAALPFISSTTTSTQLADCLFGKPPAEPTQTASLGTPPDDPSVKQGYGLFLPTRDLLPGTLAKQDEAIKAAVTRLTPKLQTLLAMKQLRATLNVTSSRLAVRLNLAMTTPQEKLLLQRETLRPQLPKSRQAELLEQQTLPLTVGTGSRLRYQLYNFNPVPLYFVFVSLDARDRMLTFLPPPATGGETITLQNRLRVDPGTMVTIPETEVDWGVEEPIGSVETLLICSTTPFLQTTDLLGTLVAKTNSQRVDLGDSALLLTQAILSDLDSGNPNRDTATDTYTLNPSTWATVAMSYGEVV